MDSQVSEKITLVFGGDFCSTEHVDAAVSSLDNPAELLGPAAKLFRESDLAIVNLEFPLTGAAKKLIKYGSHQKGCPRTITVLKEAGVDVVNIANNHILDYGEAGLSETIRTCAEAGIGVVGAAFQEENACQPYETIIKGFRISILGICENEFSVARDGRGGACRLDPIENFYRIRKVRKTSDIVIVLLHGGREFTHYPSPYMVQRCRFFVEAGATVVVCHHPHYMQGYEIYNGAPILYSLGTLFYAKMSDPDVCEVPVARIEISRESIEPSVQVEFYRVSLEKNRIVELDDRDLQAMRIRFAEYCEVLKSPQKIQEKWDDFCLRYRDFYLFYLVLVPPLLRRIARRLGILSFLDRVLYRYSRMRRNDIMCMENMIRNESHREAVLRILEKERDK